MTLDLLKKAVSPRINSNSVLSDNNNDCKKNNYNFMKTLSNETRKSSMSLRIKFYSVCNY